MPRRIKDIDELPSDIRRDRILMCLGWVFAGMFAYFVLEVTDGYCSFQDLAGLIVSLLDIIMVLVIAHYD